MDGAIHDHFGLSYAHFLVLPRVALQSMPLDWQEKFVKMLDEMTEELGEDHIPPNGYMVTAIGHNGKFAKHQIPHYRRGSIEKRGGIPTQPCPRPTREHLQKVIKQIEKVSSLRRPLLMHPQQVKDLEQLEKDQNQ